MKNKTLVLGLMAVGILSAGAYGIYQIGMTHGMGMTAPAINPATPKVSSEAPATGPIPQGIPEGEEATRRHLTAGIKAGDVDPANGSKVLYYHDPMVPGNKFDKPGKSPFMDMMLVPVYASGDTDQGRVTVSPRIQQNLGMTPPPCPRARCHRRCPL